MENKNDTLQTIKDEYARERGCSNWQEYHMNRGSKHYIITLDTIATRYAAKENEGLIRDVRELRNTLQIWVDMRKDLLESDRFDDPEVEKEFTEGLEAILFKTAHYNQNTDV